MIFKIIPNSGKDKSAINYSEKKMEDELSELLMVKNINGMSQLSNEMVKQMCADSNMKEAIFNLIKSEFDNRNSLNTRAKFKQFHAVASTSGNKETFEELAEKAWKIMQGLGYADQPMLFFSHKDTGNNHVHIVTSRIDEKGKKIDDSFEGIKANKLLNDIEGKNIKTKLDKDIENVLSFNIANKSQLKILLESIGCRVAYQKEGGLNYHKFNENQGGFTESEIDHIIGKGNKEERENRRKQIYSIIKDYMKKYDSNVFGVHTKGYSKKFESELSRKLKDKLGIELVFHAAEGKSKPYGYTIIDHSQKQIYKGSEVLKMAAFETMDEIKERKEAVNNGEINAEIISLIKKVDSDEKRERIKDKKKKQSNFSKKKMERKAKQKKRILEARRKRNNQNARPSSINANRKINKMVNAIANDMNGAGNWGPDSHDNSDLESWKRQNGRIKM